MSMEQEFWAHDEFKMPLISQMFVLMFLIPPFASYLASQAVFNIPVVPDLMVLYFIVMIPAACILYYLLQISRYPLVRFHGDQLHVTNLLGRAEVVNINAVTRVEQQPLPFPLLKIKQDSAKASLINTRALSPANQLALLNILNIKLSEHPRHHLLFHQVDVSFT